METVRCFKADIKTSGWRYNCLYSITHCDVCPMWYCGDRVLSSPSGFYSPSRARINVGKDGFNCL